MGSREQPPSIRTPTTSLDYWLLAVLSGSLSFQLTKAFSTSIISPYLPGSRGRSETAAQPQIALSMRISHWAGSARCRFPMARSRDDHDHSKSTVWRIDSGGSLRSAPCLPSDSPKTSKSDLTGWQNAPGELRPSTPAKRCSPTSRTLKIPILLKSRLRIFALAAARPFLLKSR